MRHILLHTKQLIESFSRYNNESLSKARMADEFVSYMPDTFKAYVAESY